MYPVLLIIHVLISLALIISILLQSSKGGGLGGAFGGSSDTLFGGHTASSFLKKATRVLGVAFMAIALLLALSTHPSQKPAKATGGVDEEIRKQAEAEQEQSLPLEQPPAGFEKKTEPPESEPEPKEDK